MKRILLILAMVAMALCISLPAMAQEKKGPNIEFANKTHDFGTIRSEGGEVKCEFEFTNTGTEPLVILSASSSCGCTHPKFDEKPIAPGKSSAIKVGFNPKHQYGENYKSVTVRTNDKKHKKVILSIKCVVVQ